MEKSKSEIDTSSLSFLENEPLPQKESTQISFFPGGQQSEKGTKIEIFQAKTEKLQPETNVDIFLPKNYSPSGSPEGSEISPKVEIFEPIIEDGFIVKDTMETAKPKPVNRLTEEAKYFLDLEAGEDNSRQRWLFKLS